jgi:hypothetical protein
MSVEDFLNLSSRIARLILSMCGTHYAGTFTLSLQARDSSNHDKVFGVSCEVIREVA